MGLWDRFKTLVKAEANDAISKREDPEKILNQLIIDMQEQLVTAKKQVAATIADEKRLRKSLDDELAKVAEWEQRAMNAVQGNRDDLAMEALARKAEYEKSAAEYQKQWEAQKANTEKLKEQLRALNNKIEEAKRKKNLLIAREKRAKATKSIQETMSGMNDSSAFDAFDRMSEKVDQMEAEAEAHEELAEGVTGDLLAKEIDKMSTSTSAQSDALAALKMKMGKTTAAPAPAAQQQQPVSYNINVNLPANSWDDEKF